MKILKFLKTALDPYERYVPSTTLPTFNFHSPQRFKASPMVRGSAILLPEDVKEKITSIGIKYEKVTDIGTSVEFEMWGEKKALLTNTEMTEILLKFPKVDKNAMVIVKRAWSKNQSVAQTTTELKKVNLVYSKTYITTMRTIFNKNRVADTG
jgi:hypothetical protein